MAFQRGTFLGSTVRSFTSQIGWGVGQPSQMTIALVDDPKNGDLYFPPLPGSPVYFSYGNQNFFGLLQKEEEKQGIDGKPVYEVIIVDPREILEGAQIIIGAYRGSVGGVPNLINAFGWWEQQGFGLSSSNEAGMPWKKIANALQNICNNSSSGDYGGPLSLNGISYSLDLSQMPVPSDGYRLGGSSISVMEAIAQICEDGGCDFFVKLVGYQIQICTVSRRSQPVLGTIRAAVNNGISGGNVSRAAIGLEFRNEITSSFVVGGQVTTLFQTNAIKSFWGYDNDGNAIWSATRPITLNDNAGNALTTFNTDYMLLNASPVADILGKDRYLCTTFEMQCAKGSYDTWSTYMVNQRRNLSLSSNIVGLYKQKNPNNPGKTLMADVADATPDMAYLASRDNLNNSYRLYEFVRGYADEYLGRKYAIALPFVMSYQEDETLRVVSSYSIVDSGYLEEGASPLGMSNANEDQFRNPDGRFRCFVKYNSVQNVDLSVMPAQSSVVDTGALFTEANTDPQILFEDKPYAIVTLSGVLTKLSVECAGDPTLLGSLMGTTGDEFIAMSKQEFLPHKISPDVIAPDNIAIPLQSALFTYGPWFATGAPGKVLFEQDTGLTPWDYGDYTTMEGAANAKVTNSVTNMQLSESGVLELAGLPLISLGDVLQSGGPNVTNIDVSVGPQGVTTSYRFQTYTPRFGVFNKGMSERFKRLGLAGQALRRSVRVSQRNLATKLVTNSIVAANSGKAFKENIPPWKAKKTPHTLLVGHNFSDVDTDGSAITRGTLQTATHVDAITLSNPGSGNTDFTATAIMSMNGLIRPFSTNSTSGDVTQMSVYENPSSNTLNLTTLNPFQSGHDVETYVYGDQYQSLNGFRNSPDGTNSRLFAMRGPMMITGWGFGWDGKRYPSQDGGNTFAPKYLRQQEKWKTGPLDALWDDNRKVWTCHDMIRGVTNGVLPAHGSGLMHVNVGVGSGWDVTINNHWSTAVSGSTNAMALFSALDNSWWIVAADCITN